MVLYNNAYGKTKNNVIQIFKSMHYFGFSINITWELTRNIQF